MPEGHARGRILAAAGQLFTRDGVRATGVNAIIARSGVAKATFYRHFSSKDDVVVAWLHSQVAPSIDEVLAAIERAEPSPEERLDAFFDVLADRLADVDSADFPLVGAALHLDDAPSPVRTLVEQYLADMRTILRKLSADAGAANPDEAADALQLLVLGLLVRVRAEPDARIEAVRVTRRAARRIVERHLMHI